MKVPRPTCGQCSADPRRGFEMCLQAADNLGLRMKERGKGAVGWTIQLEGTAADPPLALGERMLGRMGPRTPITEHLIVRDPAPAIAWCYLTCSHEELGA